MVVRFPSESESGAGREAGDGGAGDGLVGDGILGQGAVDRADPAERLAPVTFLPRSRGADHPSRRGSEAESSGADTASVRPVVAFPFTRTAGGGASIGDDAGDAGDALAERKRTTGRWSKAFLEESGAEAGRKDSAAAADTFERSDGGGEKQVKRASSVSIHQLARRGMSRWELEQVLAKREIEPAVAQAELDRLESVGLLDDAALAVTLVYTQHTRKGLGRSAIAQELNRRHIAPELIEEALAEIADDDELERATELAMKRVGQLSSYDDETAKRRLHGFLARKGYSSSVVRQAMDAALATRGRRSGVRFE